MLYTPIIIVVLIFIALPVYFIWAHRWIDPILFRKTQFIVVEDDGMFYPKINIPTADTIRCYEYIDKNDGKYVPYFGMTEEDYKNFEISKFPSYKEAFDFIKSHYNIHAYDCKLQKS